MIDIQETLLQLENKIKDLESKVKSLETQNGALSADQYMLETELEEVAGLVAGRLEEIDDSMNKHVRVTSELLERIKRVES
jgi:predicted  nucleic acid-binding Zn-ribbon protein